MGGGELGELIRSRSCDRHPGALGRPARESWSGPWKCQELLFAAVLERGEAACLEDAHFPVDRQGRQEDACFTVCCSPVRAEDGAVGGSLVTLAETSRRSRQAHLLRERKRALAELRDSEEERRRALGLLEGITGRTDDMIAALDGEFRFLFFNDAYRREFAKLWGREPELGLSLLEAMAPWPGQRRNAANLWGRALNGEAFGVTMEFGPSERERRIYDLRFNPVHDARGTRLGAAHILRDATERVRTLQLLHEADQRKDHFLAVLSHELRNPLAPILTSVYLLEHAAPGGEQATRARQVIGRQAQHMSRLIDDLLDVTRISHGKVTLQRDRLELNALVRGTTEDHREQYTRNGIELELVEAGEPLWVDGDRTRLAQVFGNLLNNSAKFTPPGGRTILSIEAKGPGEVVVRVRDDGMGMSPEILAHLFEPFSQGAQSIERTRGGLGLGLALVKGLVEMHGGAVAARSEGEARGSELTVTLPLQAPARAELEVAPGAGNPAVRRVLVVEDNVDAAESLREVLELDAHEVAVAYSGPAGVEAARSFKPDVVLCDIGLPGLDGYGVARTLRAEPDPAVRSSYLVALSGYALEEDVARSKAAGFDSHLAKPASIAGIEQLLRDAAARVAARPGAGGGAPDHGS